MTETASSAPDGPVAAIVVTYESAAVIEECLESLVAAAPRRGVRILAVDNASSDDSAARAARIVGESSVIRLTRNGGYAAGVNAGIAAAVGSTWIAVLNPDTVIPEGALDRLADVLAARPRAGLVAPLVVRPGGSPERTVGCFPTLARERAHAFFLDRSLGFGGRLAPLPEAEATVEWASGCAWLLRREAVHQVGPLDEGYFMYYEDVDYCRRLHDAGWEVVVTPGVTLSHQIGGGSSLTSRVPADGGRALLRYFEKFHPEVAQETVAGLLATGWRLRRAWRGVRSAFGDVRSRVVAERYRIALESLRSP